jgi:curli production assembly/transport component CsgF
MLLFSLTGFAQDLVYKPKIQLSEDTFNYQWMIGSAESQNKFKDKQERNELTELQQFTQDLNAQLLNSGIKIFIYATVWERWNIGGELHFGSLSIEVYPSSGGLTVDILDTKTGEQTQVIIPN